MVVVLIVAVLALFAAVIAGLFFLGGKRKTTAQADSYTDKQRTEMLSGERLAPSKTKTPRTSTGDN